MDKSAFLANGVLELLLNGKTLEGIAEKIDGEGGELYLALHTANPTINGNQSTNEVEYEGYGRVPVVRDGSGWTVTANIASPANAIEFGEMTGGVEGEATHASIGLLESGEGKILYRGILNPSVKFSIGSVPRIKEASTIKEE